MSFWLLGLRFDFVFYSFDNFTFVLYFGFSCWFDC